MKTITISVNKTTGAVTTKTEGFIGSSCEDATRALRDKLGTGEIEHTPEYYERDQMVNAEYLCG